MIISNSRKFIFVHIYKTAGEAITRALSPQLAWNDLELGGSRYGEKLAAVYRPRHGLWKHSRAEEIRTVIGAETWDAYYTFAVVRNPYDRAVSVYGYLGKRVARNRWRAALARLTPSLSPREPWSWGIMQAYLRSPSFSTFIRHPGFLQSRFAMPQFDFLADAERERVLVDKIVFLERLQEGFDEVCADLGLERITLGRVNVSKPVDGKVERLPQRARTVPDADDRAHLRRLYARDFEVFYPEVA